MGFLDFLFGKKPSSTLPSYLQNLYNNPSPEWLNYLQTGMVPGSTSTSGSSTSSSGTSANTYKGTTTNRYINQPFVTPDFAPLATLTRDTAYQRLLNGGIPEGYQNEGLRNIGQANTIAAKSLEDALTRRGLGRSTAAGQDVLAGEASNQNASFLNSLPMMAQANQAQDLGIAQNVIGQMGLGQMGQSAGTSAGSSLTRTTGQSDTSGFSTSPGGFDYGGYGSLMGQLQNYYAQPRQGGAFGSLASLIPYIGGLFNKKSPTSGGYF